MSSHEVTVLVTRNPVQVSLGTVVSGGGGVDSVDGQTGVVDLSDTYQPLGADLTAIDAVSGTGYLRRTGVETWDLSTPTSGEVGADASGTASSLLASHVGDSDPHPGYLTEVAAASLVTGPASATDNGIARFDGTTGKLIQDSAITIGDTSLLTMTGTAAGITFAGASGSFHNLLVSSTNTALYLRGNRVASTTNSEVKVGSAVTRTSGPILDVENNTVVQSRFNFDGSIVASVSARTSGVAGAFRTNATSHTGQTASTEVPNWHNQTYNRQWATGAITTQREIQFDAPTYSFVGASTITNAANLYVGGAPNAGTNATLTNRYAVWVDSGTSRFDDDLLLQSFADVQQISVPADPASGTRRMFVDSATGELSVRTSGGLTRSLEKGNGRTWVTVMAGANSDATTGSTFATFSGLQAGKSYQIYGTVQVSSVAGGTALQSRGTASGGLVCSSAGLYWSTGLAATANTAATDLEAWTAFTGGLGAVNRQMVVNGFAVVTTGGSLVLEFRSEIAASQVNVVAGHVCIEEID